MDLGFVGIKKILHNAEVKIGYKKTKKIELTQEEKDINQALAKERVVVEHAIAGMKRYYILRHENRIKKPHESPKMDTIVETCAALWNFRRSFQVNCA